MKLTAITEYKRFGNSIQVRFDSDKGSGDILLEPWAAEEMFQCDNDGEVMALIQTWVDDFPAIGEV